MQAQCLHGPHAKGQAKTGCQHKEAAECTIHHIPQHSTHSLPQATIQCQTLHIKLPCAQHHPIHLQYTTLALNRLGEQKPHTVICHRTHMQIGDGNLDTVLHRVLYLKAHINGIKKKKKKKKNQTKTKKPQDTTTNL